MAINYIPNDPRASSFKTARGQTPRPKRPVSRADFALRAQPAEARYVEGSQPFLFWQTREAALATLEMFENVRGAPLTRWARSASPKRLRLEPDAGVDLNAYYDGQSVSFFHFPIGTKTIFSGASTDVVAHEVGHALLDALRPDLWSASFLEAGAFHEAFGDCVAMLTALADRAVRRDLVASLKVSTTNYVETTAEDLSWAIGQIKATHNAAKPRRGHNTYRWALPSSLPLDGAPGVLINEVHSFAQIFNGCFYDLIGLLFARASTKTEAQLWKAAATAGRLLFAGADKALLNPRFFQSVGRTMALEDQAVFNGAHRESITTAFANHGIVLGSNAMVAPRAALAGSVRTGGAAAPSLGKGAVEDVRRRLGVAVGEKLLKRGLKLGITPVAEVTHRRAVDLTGLADYLNDVQAYGMESLLVGNVARSAAVMSATPDAITTEDEVRSFVEGLVARGQISHNGGDHRRGAAATRPPTRPQPATAGFPGTHQVVMRAGTKVLERQRFACGCRATLGQQSEG